MRVGEGTGPETDLQPRGKVSWFALAGLVACGNSGGDGSPGPSASYTLGGTISGLRGAGLVLANNGGGDLGVAADATSFTLALSPS